MTDSSTNDIVDTSFAETASTGLPVYPGIARQDVCLVSGDADAEAALQHLSAAAVIGFDTETKPVFQKGQKSGGPHLIQLATGSRAFLFPVVQPQYQDVLKAILEAPAILKVGFGLTDDIRYIRSKFGFTVTPVLDLARALRRDKQHEMGAKAAVEKYFGQYLQKSKKISTSNWAQTPLQERQILYAANDAQVALLVYLRWHELEQQRNGATTATVA